MITAAELDDFLPLMTPEELRALGGRIGRIQAARRLRRHVEAAYKPGMDAMSELMLAVTHAASCRAHMRAWAGHKAFGVPGDTFPITFRDEGSVTFVSPEPTPDRRGLTPQHGRMWTAMEGARAAEFTRWLSDDAVKLSRYGERAFEGRNDLARGFRTALLSVSPMTLDARANKIFLQRYGYSWPSEPSSSSTTSASSR